MTKAASISLGLVLLLAGPATISAQPAPAQAAVNEAVRRQSDTILLRQKLVDAKAAAQRGEVTLSAKLYEDAWALVQGIGAGVESEAADTVVGLVAARLELANAASKRGDLREADTQVTRALKVSPQDQRALEFKRSNDRALAEMAGRMPTEAALDRAAEISRERVDASTKVQDGRLLLEMGKLDEAERVLQAAIEMDPESRAAFYYMSLVKERRYAEAERRREQASKSKIVEVARAWEEPTSRQKLPVPNPDARNTLIHTSRGRQAIVAKLDRIRVDSISYDGLPLGEVVRNLSDEARRRDPEKRGINFIINPHVETSAQAVQTTIDPATGQLIALPSAPEEAVDVSGIAIKLDPPLNDVRLADILDAITKVAERPIKYSIEDYAVVFSVRGAEPLRLETRRFKVDPNTFYQGLEQVGSVPFGDIETSTGSGGGGGGRSGGSSSSGQGGQGNSTLSVPRVSVAGGFNQGGGGGGGGIGGGGGGGQGGGLRFITQTNSMEEVSAAVRNFFITLGVDLNPPKSVFFNDRQGTLLVRATAEDLDIIETAVQALNIAPPQVNIKARFAEITQNDQRALGFDWYFGNILAGGDRGVAIGGGSAPSFNGPPSAANPNGFFPGTSLPNSIPSSSSDQLITSGLRSTIGDSTAAPAIATITGILTDPQFRVVIKALEQRDGVDLLSAPEITTLSGRQAQIQVVDIRTIVTGQDANQTGAGGGGGGVGTTVSTGGGVSGVGTIIQPTTQPLPFGPVLDVIPYVSADGYTVQMTIIPTITEFIGYDDPGQFVTQAQSVAAGVGVPLTAQLPLPRFRLRQVTTSTIVWDGQTVVLGGLLSEDVARMKDKVPVLGDLPWLGKLFRSEATSTKKKNLMIFVTPTIIDPAGNRYHNEADLPFAQTSPVTETATP